VYLTARNAVVTGVSARLRTRFQRRAAAGDLTFADELADRGITVNTVNPGPNRYRLGLADQDPAHVMPFGRWGRGDDAARLITWLCSDEALWITAQTIDSEGGFRRWSLTQRSRPSG